jgi:glycosyltransferase involved in cell wall biosynthesis
VHEITWKGYGISKNEASTFAVYDWVLSMDADEKIDATLYEALKNWEPESNTTVYRVLWKNFFGDQWIRHGNWNNDWKNRLFYRHIANWDDAVAHEDIRAAVKLSYVKMPGYVEHYSFDNVQQYAAKMVQSAILTANKYHLKKKKATFLKIGFSPIFTFFKTYVLKAGFMDGRKGALIAVTTAYYTFLKYVCLYELNKTNKA